MYKFSSKFNHLHIELIEKSTIRGNYYSYRLINDLEFRNIAQMRN